MRPGVDEVEFEGAGYRRRGERDPSGREGSGLEEIGHLVLEVRVPAVHHDGERGADRRHRDARGQRETVDPRANILPAGDLIAKEPIEPPAQGAERRTGDGADRQHDGRETDELDERRHEQLAGVPRELSAHRRTGQDHRGPERRQAPAREYPACRGQQ